LAKQKRTDQDVLGTRLEDLLDSGEQEELATAQLEAIAAGVDAPGPDDGESEPAVRKEPEAHEQPAPGADTDAHDDEQPASTTESQAPAAEREVRGAATETKMPTAESQAVAVGTQAPADAPGLPDASEPAPDASQPAAAIEVDDADIMETFLEETGEHLQTIEERVVELERSAAPDLVDEIFRAMHTIKGTAAFLGDNPVATLSHALETLLDAVRSSRMELSTELVDVLLAGSDEISRMIAELSAAFARRREEPLPVTLPVQLGATPQLLERIRAVEAGNDDHRAGNDPQQPEDYPQEAAGQADSENPALPPSDELFASFVAESSDLLKEAERDVLALEDAPENIALVDKSFRNIHTIKGNAGFLGLARVEELCSQIEEVLDVLRRGSRAVSQPIITAVLQSLDSLQQAIRRYDEHAPGTATAAGAGAEEEYKPLGEILVAMGLADETAVERALDSQDRKLGELLVSEGVVSEQQVEKALEQQRAAQSQPTGGTEPGPERQVVRVDVAKLDNLFELTGELILAEAMVVSNPDLEGLDLDRFHRSAKYLGKITRQMQEVAMSVRMIPLEGLFNKMRRLVRDLSKKNGKPVDIRISGQDTETDRNVIEVLSDPLVHMIRNAADHGIESAQEREAAGKAATGHIDLGARYEGSEIWITVRDDGRGLDRRAIIEKAMRRGLITPEEAEKRSDRQVWDLLFEPGFSTRDQVTDVSGRGVGMDVVKRNLEQLRGSVEVDTAPGAWTEVTLKIPLTLAIVDGVTTRVGNTLYTVPLGDIREFQRAESGRIVHTHSSGEVLNLREEILPIVRAREFFGAAAASQNGSAHTDSDARAVLIVVQSGENRGAILVDEVVGYNQIVVKGVPEYMGTMRGVGGCTVLGSGDVSLVVDTNAVLRESGKGKRVET
jgi:two-component system chemotaxis sensor kinase CheA